MRNLIILIIIAVCCPACKVNTQLDYAMPKNWFVAGTVWLVRSEATTLVTGLKEDKISFDYFKLEDGHSVDGQACMAMYRSIGNDCSYGDSPILYEENPILFVRSEEQKVYYWNNTADGGRWELVYDFDLHPGDECEIAIYDPDVYEYCFKMRVRCVWRGATAAYNGYPYMTVENVAHHSEDAHWLIGLGSFYSPFESIMCRVGGYNYSVISVTHNGRTIYHDSVDGVAR